MRYLKLRERILYAFFDLLQDDKKLNKLNKEQAGKKLVTIVVASFSNKPGTAHVGVPLKAQEAQSFVKKLPCCYSITKVF